VELAGETPVGGNGRRETLEQGEKFISGSGQMEKKKRLTEKGGGMGRATTQKEEGARTLTEQGK